METWVSTLDQDSVDREDRDSSLRDDLRSASATCDPRCMLRQILAFSAIDVREI